MIFSSRKFYKKYGDWIALFTRRKQFLNLGASSAVQIIISMVQLIIVVRVCGLTEWKYQTIGVLAGSLSGSLIDAGLSVASNGYLSKLSPVYFREFYKASLLRRGKKFLLILLSSPLISLVIFQNFNYIFMIFMVAQASLALTSEWILIAIDELQHFGKYFTFPKLMLSSIGLLLVWLSNSSIPIAAFMLFFVAYSNRQISNFLGLQNKFAGTTGKIKRISIPKTNLAFTKLFGDVYWVIPGILMQFAGSPFLVSFLLWERITKFFIAPSTVASQSITGILTTRKLNWKVGLVFSIKNHVLIAFVFSLSGYFVIRFGYDFLSKGSSLSEEALIFTIIFISCVILNRSFLLHGFFFSTDKKTPLVANALLFSSYVLLFLPIFRERLEYVIFHFAFFQFIVLNYFIYKSGIFKNSKVL